MGHRAVGRKRKKTVALVLVIVLGLLIAAGAYFVYNAIEGKEAYPLKYEDIIVKYAQENELDPYFVAAVIHAESNFDPQAVSRAGAIGLMQIMPPTGEWIAGKLGVEDFDSEMLKDPETSIRFGCWYLNFLSDKFEDNRQLIVAGYNAGHNRVAEWLKDKDISDGETLKDIPFKETEGYVKNVEKSYDKYKEFYEIG